MITAHIKSPFGDRDEEWEDNRIAPEFSMFVENYTAYVLGYDDGSGSEIVAIVSKLYWGLFREALAFAHDEPGDQPGMNDFTKTRLQSLASAFKQYLDIEKAILERSTTTGNDYNEMIAIVENARQANTKIYEDIVPFLDMINRYEQTSDTKKTVRGLLQAQFDFSNALYENILTLQVVLEGLKLRGQGGDYSSLDYLRDIDLLRQSAEKRREPEKALTTYRSAFMRITEPA